jgi:hypothetical protein
MTTSTAKREALMFQVVDDIGHAALVTAEANAATMAGWEDFLPIARKLDVQSMDELVALTLYTSYVNLVGGFLLMRRVEELEGKDSDQLELDLGPMIH